MAAMRLREVTTREELSELAGCWDGVLERSGSGSPFLTFDWITTWWDHFGRERDLLVLVAEDDEGVAGLAPLAIGRYRRCGIPLRALEFIGAPFDGRRLATRLDLVVSRRAEQCLAAFADAIAANARRWDICSLRTVPAASPHVERMGQLARSELTFLSVSIHHVLSIDTQGRTWEQYLAERHRKVRQDVRRVQRLATKAGLPAVEWLETPDEVTRALPQLARVCAASWKARAGTALFLESAPEAEFLRALVKRTSRQNEVVLTAISHRDQIIAYLLSFKHSGTFWLYDTAYDPDWDHVNPGINTFGQSVHAGFRPGLERIDLGPGHLSYKQRWAEGSEARVRWLGFHRGCRSRLIHLAVRMAVWLRRFRGSGQPPPGAPERGDGETGRAARERPSNPSALCAEAWARRSGRRGRGYC